MGGELGLVARVFRLFVGFSPRLFCAFDMRVLLGHLLNQRLLAQRLSGHDVLEKPVNVSFVLIEHEHLL